MYPAGSKQGRVKLPAIVLVVDAEQLMSSEDTEQQVAQAVGAGATAVLLTGGTSGDLSPSAYMLRSDVCKQAGKSRVQTK